MSRSKKKDDNHRQSDLGIFNPAGGLEAMDQMMYGNVDQDNDLEAELAALMGGGGTPSPKSPARNQAVAPKDISRMAAAAAADIDEDDGEVDENDPDLLAELAECMGDDDDAVGDSPVHSPVKTQSQNSASIIQLLSARIQNYQAAIEAAKAGGESSKVRRFERSLGTLRDMVKKAEKGGSVPEDDIPPEVVVKSTPRPSGQAMMMNMVNPVAPPAVAPPRPPVQQTAPVQQRTAVPAPQLTSGGVNMNTLRALTVRQTEYKSAALKAKTLGNIEQAKEFLMVAKQFDGAIEAVKTGENFDLEDMPPTPEATAAPAPPPEPAPAPKPPAGGSLLSALSDRLATFQSMQKKAQDEANSSKERRYKRIVDQYAEAVKTCRANKLYDYRSLPDLPGGDPLPLQAAPRPPAPQAAPQVPSTGGPPPKLARSLSRNGNQQMVFLVDRQTKFKAAALTARNRGQMDLAKQLLRQAKSFDQVISAAESGLPVDLSKMPALPGEKNIDFEFLEAEECDLPDDLQNEDRDTLYSRLQRNLLSQIKTAQDNSTRFLKIGDVVTADKFQKLAKTCKLDLLSLENANKHNDPVPRFHYEWKTFSVMDANPDLAENDFEFTVKQGIDLAVPSGFRQDQLDTYVKIEFPLPSDSPQTHQTDTVKSTNSPEYNSVAKFQASRKSRALLRLIQSKGIKLEIFYRRGILKKDGVLGSVVAKLPSLEKSCTVHECFDVMEGRKAIGGKLEVQVRIREPIAGKMVEDIREKWLVIDDYDRPKRTIQTAPANHASSPSIESIEVLQYERNLIQQKMSQLQARLTQSTKQTLTSKILDLDKKIRALQPLTNGKPEDVKRYIVAISPLIQRYTQEAQSFLQQGNRERAQVQMTKKKLVEKEVAQLKVKIGLR